MTDTLPLRSDWQQQFNALGARYPSAPPGVLMALHLFSQNPGIGPEEAKAQAELHGIRITAASVNAARRHLAGSRGATVAGSPPPRGPLPPAGVDAEALIRQVVGRLQRESSANAERMREGVREAIRVLQAALAVRSPDPLQSL